MDEIHQFVVDHPSGRLKIEVLDRKEHAGKSSSLNFALKYATGEVVIVSDSDCFWPSDILARALPYLSDPNVGAVAGREVLLNSQLSWVTKSEVLYNSFVQTIRHGESKAYSTIFFQGGFAAYKKDLLCEFDRETDDSGTALNIVQKNARTLIIPEVTFYTVFPTKWKNKVITKMRRANQLQRIWIRCFGMLIRRKLILPKSIAVPEIYLHIFGPLVFAALIATTTLLVLGNPLLLPALLLILLPLLSIQKSRIYLVEGIQNNLILLVSMATMISSRNFNVWKTVDESRSLLSEKTLREKCLI